jgi:hypothetical protein
MMTGEGLKWEFCAMRKRVGPRTDAERGGSEREVCGAAPKITIMFSAPRPRAAGISLWSSIKHWGTR